MINPDEEVPVRGITDYAALKETTTFTKDEEQESTLRRMYVLLKSEVAELHKFNAFDLKETDLKIKQQIKVHQIAAGILEPIVEAFEQALMQVDETFRQRNNK